MRSPRVLILGDDRYGRAMASEMRLRLPAAIERGTDAEIGALPEGPFDLLLVAYPMETDPGRVADGIGRSARGAVDAGFEAPWLLAVDGGLDLSRFLLRRTGARPSSILSLGGLPRLLAERRRLARLHQLCRSQIDTIGIGGESADSVRILARYTRVAGVPVGVLPEPDRARRRRNPPEEPREDDRIAAAVVVARAVILDREEPICCGGWVEGRFGLPGGYVTAPHRISAGGAGEPLLPTLTLDERAHLIAEARM